MNIQLLRSATLIVEIGSHRLLVDPMLSRKEAMDPVMNAGNSRRIPLVELPFSDDELAQRLSQIDAVLVTHTHRDHWDSRAIELIPKTLPLFCQPGDEAVFRGQGFTTVTPIDSSAQWEELTFSRADGHHGTGEIGQKMGKVSGFVLRAEDEPTLYIAGDTIWCAEVEQALNQYQPDVVVVNACAAEFLVGGPIIMTAEDVMRVCQSVPNAKVVAVHMETVNHCMLSRADLRLYAAAAAVESQVLIPADGETFSFQTHRHI